MTWIRVSAPAARENLYQSMSPLLLIGSLLLPGTESSNAPEAVLLTSAGGGQSKGEQRLSVSSASSASSGPPHAKVAVVRKIESAEAMWFFIGFLQDV